MNAPLPPRIHRFRTQAQIDAERGQPTVRLLTAPTSDLEASRAWHEAVFGPPMAPMPDRFAPLVTPEFQAELAAMADPEKIKEDTRRWVAERRKAREELVAACFDIVGGR